MMPKQWVRAAAIVATAVGLGGCDQSAPESAAKSKSSVTAVAPAERNAGEIAAALQTKGLPVTNVRVVTEATDDNNLLGRPNQYTSKVFFFDSRHLPSDGSTEGECTIEVFASAEDAQRRHDYVAQMTRDMPMLLQYQILVGRTLIRLDKALLPLQVEAYRAAMQ